MTPAKQLRIAIENCELQHPLFLEQYTALRQRIDDALDGGASRIERVIGPSRAGKSMLLQALRRDYPETNVGGRRRVPVLVVPIPTPASPLLLPSSMLTALKLPVPNRISAGEMCNRVFAQLELAGTRVTLFEEANHLVELGTKVPPRASGDWFKMLSDVRDMTMVMFSIPRLERLFECNEQLRMRASAPRWMMPYDSRIPDQLRAFHGCVATYANLFRERGFPIEFPARALTYQCYLLSGGLIGVLSRFMQELASQMAFEAPRPLSFLDCQAAARAIEVAGSRYFRAFERPDEVQAGVAPAALHQAFVQVMNDNDIPVPLLPALAGGEQ